MAMVPLRELAKYGVLTDVDAYDLPPEAWSFGVNARFRNGKVSRSPVFRAVKTLDNTAPRYAVGSSPTSGLDLMFIGYQNGVIQRYSSGSLTDYSISGYTPSAADAAWSDTSLASVLYVNREDRVPWSFLPAAAAFTPLANWNASWRAHLLRTCGGALVALNVTKGATNYPTMVKTSSIPQAGVVPASWDETNPATLATENILADLTGQITDAQTFGSSLCIYSPTEAVLMTPDGSLDVYSYRKLPFKKGAINANCSIEIDGRHYVFGPDDCWTHDGYSEVSLCVGKTRDFIFNGINLSRASQCFVVHNPKTKEIHFCYVSGDRGVAFLNSPDGCNRQAVYNYIDKTWTFDDLPNARAATLANINTQKSYATVAETYELVGGTYLDQEDGFKRTLVYVGTPSVTYGLSAKLYAFDLFGPGSTVVFGVDTAATKPLVLEKSGLDLDALGAELRGYKVISSIYPQARLEVGASPLVFEMGSADYFSQEPAFEATQTYDGQELYKLDYRSAGRVLSLRISYADFRPFSLSGLDFDFSLNSER